MSGYLFLIPLLPLLGFVLNFAVGTRLAKPKPFVTAVAWSTVALSLLLSIFAVIEAAGSPGHQIGQVLFSWIPGGMAETVAGPRPFAIDWALRVDPLSSVMLMVVCGVGFLIHVYAAGYMAHDPGYARFFSYLNLFMFSMLTLVMGANFLVLFVGWEGVGLCSYLLIGFWYHKQSAADAGKKAFIVNRVGDAFFLIGLFTLFVNFGSLDFATLTTALAGGHAEAGWDGPLTFAALMLFLGACGKSAQVPLYVWLPDAMEGPTPVSALIHAATMVTAGVYMVARSSALYVLAPNALLVVALVGAFTAIFAASIGLVQTDIKRVLAYSTVSQLGYMFLACGVGAFSAGVFHLGTHAFFKALLFLCAGSVIHAMSGEQELPKMGGLRKKLPWTHATMLIGCIAIAGIPPLAGFFSKDEILWLAFSHGGYGQLVWAVGLVTAGMTAFYMFRLYHLTFSGSFRGTHEQEHHLHESPKVMTIPLALLAVGAVTAGLLGIPAALGGSNWIEHFLHPAIASLGGHGAAAGHDGGHGTELLLMGVSIAVAAAGIGVAWMLYGGADQSRAAGLAKTFAPAHRLLLNKYWVDELYGKVFVRGVALGGGHALHGTDKLFVDGGGGEVKPGLGVNGLAWFTRDVISKLSNLWDRYVVDGLVNLTGHAFDNGSYYARHLQNGFVQHYILYSAMGVLLLVGLTRLATY